MRVMRWDCEAKGCYRQLMPRLGAFDDCFDGKIGMSDVDGVVEVRGRFLFLEWKSAGGAVTTGQRIMFERMTGLSPKITVIVVAGHPREMTVETVTVFHGGRGGKSEPCDLLGLKARIFAWQERAKRDTTRPSQGIAAA